MPAKAKIESMFDSIAGDYDKLNHILSLGIDKTWRKRALKEIVDGSGPMEVLDLACGTGDFSIAVAKASDQVKVTGVDLSEGMLAVMAEKVGSQGLEGKISYEQGDGENLRFADGTFNRVTIAFGIRNYEDRLKGLREMLRVLKPGGKVVILELSRPENKIIRWFYDIYFLRIMPVIGGKVSGDKAAYAYLPASVKTFPGKEDFSAIMAQAGFKDIRHKAFSLGICRMYTGEKNKIN